MTNNIPSGNSSPFKGDQRGSGDSIKPFNRSDDKLVPSGNSSPYKGDHRGFISSTILIGHTPLGGSSPIRLQSMTNTDTLDTKASVAQCIRIIEAGADFVRLTTQGVREAENLAVIKSELRKAGFNTPLIADIHFNPTAAETAARLVEKVRINPGNYTDKRASFQSVDLSDQQYNEELERIHARLLPLIKICTEHGTVIRIGINHGSLSDRIMTRYGNTPEGMVQSALEFIRVFRNENFNNLVLSMKSSDTDVMIRSTRMLVAALMAEGLAYPIHLGVTEAGEGEDGRIRSAAGIGALLQDGIGDTIRVSLSEDPEKEIPVARKLAEFFPREKTLEKPAIIPDYKAPENKPEIFRGVNGPLVLADFRSIKDIKPDTWLVAGFRKNKEGNIIRSDFSADLVLVDSIPEELPADVRIANPSDSHAPLEVLPLNPPGGTSYLTLETGNDKASNLRAPLGDRGSQSEGFDINVSPSQLPLNPPRGTSDLASSSRAPLGDRGSKREGLDQKGTPTELRAPSEVLPLNPPGGTSDLAWESGSVNMTGSASDLSAPLGDRGSQREGPDQQSRAPLGERGSKSEGPDQTEGLNVILSDSQSNVAELKDLSPENTLVVFRYDPVLQQYAPYTFMKDLWDNGLRLNIILNPKFSESTTEDLQIRAAGTLGVYLTDNRIAGIMISNSSESTFNELTGTAFSILQCTDKRITRTIYLSCPTCGRTKFNLQETVRKVKAATGHLKGLKIAVMGCIVNGPGEMAGADYGYVGAAPGKVHIYKGVNPVLKNVPEENAIYELLRVIGNV